MKPRTYCCCAIPVVNPGIYAVLTEQFALGIIAGTLSVATPSIVGAATPSAARWVFAVICYVAAITQILGFIGVAKEKPILFRRYTTLHVMLTLAAFSVAAVWVALSGARHSTAKKNCEDKFFASNTTDLSSEGETMCEIFPWVDVGLMGGLWALLAISQLYFYIVISGYGSGQRDDHEKYDSVYSPSKPLNNDIPMTNRSDTWDARPSTDSLAGENNYGHGRHDSNASDATMLGDRYQQPPPFRDSPSYPAGAYTQQPVPTPLHAQYSDPYYSNNTAIGRPEQAQAHPG